MKAFVAGATGGTGQWIVRELVNRGVSVRALVRDADRGRELLPEGVDLVVGDVLNVEAIASAIADCEVVFCATGARPSLDPTGPLMVDFVGTKNLVEATKKQNCQRFIIVSSMCVSNLFHPLNLFWLVLFWKKQAEEYIAKSGLTYTIVRPGGLKNEDDDRRIVMAAADTLSEGSIPRQKVAKVCVEAMFGEYANNKIVEVVATESAAEKTIADLFAAVV
jgi:uncharacterized protein YbjT (DUF2867 family)